MSAAAVPTVHELGQLRHLDLLALAVRRGPGTDQETRYARMSREGLIDLLTRPQAARSGS